MFLDVNGHSLKTVQSADCSRNQHASLFKQRKNATEAFVETINVDDIMEFTEPIRHLEQGIFNFDFAGVLVLGSPPLG